VPYKDALMIDAVFKVVGTNPASILIVLGSLFMFTGFVGMSIQVEQVAGMTWFGLGCIVLGTVLHVMWLRRGRKWLI
jgi:hypothetical protein